MPDYSVFATWNQLDLLRGEQPFLREEDTDDLMRSPVSTDSIAHLAFLVKICHVLPDNFPSPLSPVYFLNDIVMPLADFHNSLKQENVNFFDYLLDQISDRSLNSETVSPLLKDRIVDFLKEASVSENEKTRKRLYLLVQKSFLKIDGSCLGKFIGNIWASEGMSSFPAILEVLVMAVKKPLIDSLRNTSSPAFSQEDYRYLFKLFFSTESLSVSNACGLLANICGVFTVVLSLDKDNKTGVKDVFGSVVRFYDRWKKAVNEHMEQMKEEMWSRREAERLGSKKESGKGDGSIVPEVTADQAQMIAQRHEFDAGILLIALDSLSVQINRVKSSSVG